MYIPAGDYQQAEYGAYVVLFLAIFSLFWLRYRKKRVYLIAPCVLFAGSVGLAIQFYIQDFRHVFSSQGLRCDLDVILFYSWSLFLCLFLMLLFVVVASILEYNRIVLPNYLKLGFWFTVFTLVLLCNWHHYWSIRALDDVTIQLLLALITSLDDYKIFAFVYFGFFGNLILSSKAK